MAIEGKKKKTEKTERKEERMKEIQNRGSDTMKVVMFSLIIHRMITWLYSLE